MDIEIHYGSLILSFLGRNGEYNCTGLSIEDYTKIIKGLPYVAKFIRVFPITSKGLQASCYIEIPKDKIQELINHLETLK